MIGRRDRRIVAWAVMALALLVAPIQAQQSAIADPVPVEPQRTQVIEPPAPMTMLVEEVELMLEAVRRQAGSGASLMTRTDGPADAATGGISRNIRIDVPAVVNHTPYFTFEDATDRRVPGPSTRATPEQRRSAVEAYRQSLAADKQRQRGKSK